MRALIQRVAQASVSRTEPTFEEHAIKQGYVVFLGVGHEDDKAQAEKLWNKISKLRLFEDEVGKTNLSLSDIEGSVLLVSQFTLYADCKKGNRPSFTKAGAPDKANELYEYFTQLIMQSGIPVETGWFGNMMNVSLVNEGPFTIWLDTDTL